MNCFWQLDIAASILSVLLLIVMLVRKSYPTLQRKIFKILILFNFLSSFVEIISTLTIFNVIVAPQFCSNLIVILYYCIHITLHFIFLLYVISSFRGSLGTKAEKIVLSIVYVAMILFIVTNPLHHLIFNLNAEVYYGPFIFVLEVGGVVSLFYAFGLTIINKKKLQPFQYGLDIFFLFVWLFAIIAEYIFSPTLIDVGVDVVFVENFIITVTFSTLTIITDNPSQYFYGKTTIYNEETFAMVYAEKLSKGLTFDLVVFNFKDFNLYIQKVGAKRANVAYVETLKHCQKNYGQNNVFALSRSVVAIDARAFKDTEKDCAQIAQNCYEGGLRANPDCKLICQFVCFNCPNDCTNIADLHTAIYLMLFGENNLSDDLITYFDKKLLSSRHRKEQIILKLHEAIENDGFEMYYQPLFDWKKNKHVGLEALIRFKGNAESEDYISPGEFIPIAEDEGLIFAIDEIVFEKVCRFCRNVDIKKYGIEFVDINLSLLKLLDEDTVDRYTELAFRYDLDPTFINLEITETAEGDEKYLNIVRQNIARFREKGFSFSLDDYGSGYSTVIYMAEMDTKLVKIDSTILWNAMKNKKYYTVLENCVRLIYCFDKECLVEGVETEEMANVLKRLGVDYFQGYYYCKPKSEEDILKFLSIENSKSKN